MTSRGLPRGEKGDWVPGKEGGPVLKRGATSLTSCWGDGCLPTLHWALLHVLEPEAAVRRRGKWDSLGVGGWR